MDVPDCIMREFLNIGFVCARTIGFRDEVGQGRRSSLARDKWLLLAAENGKIQITNRAWTIEANIGEIAIIPPTRYCWFNVEGSSVRVLRMPMHSVGTKSLPVNPLKRLSLPQAIAHRDPLRHQQILDQIQELTNASTHARHHAARLTCNVLLNELLCEFIVAGFETNTFTHWDRVIPQWLQHARRTLEKNYKHVQYTIADLAHEMNVSEGHLYRSFKQAFGQTPRQALIEYRMAAACQLLTAYSNHTVQHVLEQVGYRSAAEFIIAFKKHTGMHPGEFRKKSAY